MVDAPYPFQSRFFEHRELRLHYLDEGAGDPVVMLHGNPTWSFYYRRLIEALRPNHRVIAPDHIGCGLSDKPGDDRYDYTLARRVDDLDAFLEWLGVNENVTLVLHDWGGMIGMAWACRHPERIARIVVLNTAAFPMPATKKMPVALSLCRGPLGAFLVRGLNLFCTGALIRCVARDSLSKAERQAYLRPYDSWSNRIAIHRFIQDIPLGTRDRSFGLLHDIAGKLDAFRETPLLILWGMRDFVFDTHFLAEWERRFPDARVHRFEDAGHYVLEDAFDEIRPLVEEFLRPSS